MVKRVVTTSDLTVTSSNGKVDNNNSCAPSTSASTACFKELPVVQSICSASVKTVVSMDVGAIFSTQPTEESTSVEGREDVVKVVQLPKT